ncbi:LCP family protein [Motilibacter aurantiacus]|uniref:LCP family protein n=1 Tax=Motilibacter aurantiacus TaxID=2714955 RepID=UPI00140765E2|nr:LCP family protein [Motilibacter aurantiacus]NHC43855.1 LCP family protein [Motilibacter aurantiacus]
MTSTPGPGGSRQPEGPTVIGPAEPPRPGSARHAQGPAPAGRGARALRWTAAAVAAAVVGVSVVGWAADSRIDRISVFGDLASGGQPARTTDRAQNILLVGSDSREDMSRKDRARLHVGSTNSAAGRRADTMMLLHVSEDQEKATLVSFPRDSYVTIPAHTYEGKQVPAQKNKINVAYAAGGPALTIATIAQATGIHIDHYVEIDFLGFEKMVNAVGGVEICTPRALKDDKSGLDIPAGTSELDGEMGLKYVRARYIDSDFGRIDRQQKFLGAIVRKATSAGTLTNPVKVTKLVNALLSSVTVDEGLSRGDMLDLARELGGLSPSALTFATIPIADDDFNPPGPLAAAVVWDEAKADDLFGKIRDDLPLTSPTPEATASTPAKARVEVPPSQVRVEVLNGAGVTGLAGRAAADLKAVGFAVTGTGNADSSGATETVVRYDSRYTESIKTVQAALPAARAEAVEGLGATLQVVVGSGYTKAQDVTVAKADPEPSASPSEAVPGKTSTAADASCT